jgi:hypothetical protein
MEIPIQHDVYIWAIPFQFIYTLFQYVEMC